MCIACITGLLSAGTSLTAAKGATGLIERRRRRIRRRTSIAIVALAIGAAGLLPVSVGGTSRPSGGPPAAQPAASIR